MGVEWLDVSEGSLFTGSRGFVGRTGVGAEGLIQSSSGGSEIDGFRAKGPGLVVWIHVSVSPKIGGGKVGV